VFQERKKGDDKEEDEKKRGKGEPEPKKPAGDAATSKKSK
jgi:hypothetical protein